MQTFLRNNLPNKFKKQFEFPKMTYLFQNKKMNNNLKIISNKFHNGKIDPLQA